MSPIPSDRGRRDRAREILNDLLPYFRARLTAHLGSSVSDDLLATLFHAPPDLRLASDGVRRTGPGIWLPTWGYAWLADP